MWDYLYLQVSTRANSERNLPNLVSEGGVDTWIMGLSLSRLGFIVMLKSPIHIAGTVGC